MAPITFSEEDGVRFLHFGTEWIQGAMRLKKPDEIELEYARQMMATWLFVDHPRHVMQLGLGAAALTKFCYRELPNAQVTAVELHQDVITAAHSMFRLPPEDDPSHDRPRGRGECHRSSGAARQRRLAAGRPV